MTASSKVIEAAHVQLQRHSVGADHLDSGVLSQDPERSKAGSPDEILGADADQLRLLPAREGFLPTGALGQRNFGSPDDAAGVRRVRELLHLSEEPI